MKLPASFTRLMTTRFLFEFAVQVQSIVLGWQMYMLTRNPLYLGLIGLAEAVPALSLGLYAGFMVDRGAPLTILKRILALSLLSAIVMLISQISLFNFTVTIQVTALFISSFISGMARAFGQPTVFALAPRLITRAEMPRASAWMATTMQAARITGPALGGLLFGVTGVAGAAIGVCVLLLASLFTTTLIQTPAPQNKLATTESISERFLAGVRFVFRHPILFPALSLDMVSVLFGGVTALLPIYASDILFIGPQGLGLLRAAPAIGAVLCGLQLTKIDFKKFAGAWFFSSVAAFGICILIFAISRNVYLSFFALLFSGAFDGISMVVRTTAVQLSSPDSMRGRISAVNSMFIGSSNELGEFESGVAARLLGTVPAAVFGAFACIATVIGIAYFAPKLRKLDLGELTNQLDS